MTAAFDPYYTWLGIAPEEHPVSLYRLLGLRTFEPNVAAIENAADRVMTQLRQFQSGRYGPLSQQLLNEVSAAQLCLLDPTKKAAYDCVLQESMRAAEATTAAAIAPPSLDLESAPKAVPLDRVDRTSSANFQQPHTVSWTWIAVASLVVALGVGSWLGYQRLAKSPAKEAVAIPQALALTAKPSGAIPNQATPPAATPPAVYRDDVAQPVEKVMSADVATADDVGRPSMAAAPFPAAEAGRHQCCWADHLGQPVTMTNSIDMSLVLIPPGEFAMGSLEGERAQLLRLVEEHKLGQRYRDALGSESPSHKVRITRPFYLGRCEVTQKQFAAVMGMNPSTFAAGGGHKDKIQGANTEDFPVDNVSWAKALEFCRRLSALRAEAGQRRTYRLPTEAEWEYACRAGSATRYSWGDSDAQLNDNAWSSRIAKDTTHPVGQKRPNPWGLHDMLGNTCEWCNDWYGEDYYRQSPTDDPPGPPSGSARVFRGGGWNGPSEFVRSATRPSRSITGGTDYIGFRVVCTLAFQPVPVASRAAGGAVNRAAEKVAAGPSANSPSAAPPAAHAGAVIPQEKTPASSPAAAGQGKKLAVPSDAEQEPVRKAFSDTYRNEIQTARGTVEKADLAKTFLANALKPGSDRVTRYVLLAACRDLAGQAADTETGFTAIDRLGEFYKIDVWPMKLDVLTSTAKKAHSLAVHKSLAEQALALLDSAFEGDDLSAAHDLVKFAHSEAAISRDKDLIQMVRNRSKDVDEADKAFDRVKQARGVLKNKPDDPSASLEVGRYLCLVVGDWDKGLPLLANAGDEAYKAAAQQELKAATSLESLTALGDAWWDLAEKRSQGLRNALRLHAYTYYLEIRSRLTGAEATKVNKRISAIRSLLAEQKPPPQIENHTDGSTLVLIPGGKFFFGPDPFVVDLPPYYIGLCEVSNSQYRSFVVATGHRPPEDWEGSKFPGQGDFPVASVSWNDAVEYCRWAGLRLAAELEWEKGARGTDGRLYPWGNEWGENHHFPRLAVVSCPENQSPYGLYHMSGNVFEWVSGPSDAGRFDRFRRGDFAQTMKGQRLACGGAAGHTGAERRCTHRLTGKPDDTFGDVGFRVARDVFP